MTQHSPTHTISAHTWCCVRLRGCPALALSSHRFPTAAAESAALIYNYSPVYTPGGYFEQRYMFDRRSQ